jgi:hypothetical protein
MLTVHEVAQLHGVSDAFMVLALDKIGCKNTTSGTALSLHVIERFEAVYGERIRKARPRDTTPIGSLTRPEPKPHVMRIAHERITSGRNPAGFREKRLLADPGVVHAIDLVGTRDGDLWSSEVVPGEVHFFDGTTNSGPTAACGRVHMRAVLGDEFVPEQDPVGAGQCPRCAELVATDKGFRNPPRDDWWYDPFCSKFLRVRIDGNVEVQDCSLRSDHRGPHRTRDGATWDTGFDDFVPAPLDANRRISKES